MVLLRDDAIRPALASRVLPAIRSGRCPARQVRYDLGATKFSDDRRRWLHASNFGFSETLVKLNFGFSVMTMLSVFQKNTFMELDSKTIARVLKERKLSKSGLAAALGIKNSGVTDLLNKGRRLRAEELPVALKYLQLDTVPVIGYVGAGARTVFFPDNTAEWDRVPAPEGSTDKTAALEVRGESLGALFEHWLVYFDRVEQPITRALYGKLCVVWQTEPEERVLVKKIQPSGVKGRFHLLSNTEGPILDQKVQKAARVRLMSPRPGG